jgi:quercetin dioxygenase-like cupin family protein
MNSHFIDNCQVSDVFQYIWGGDKLKVQNYRQVEGREVVPGVIMRVVAGPEEGSPTFVMRVFEIRPGSAIPSHEHPWEHELFVISGDGIFKSGDINTSVKEGDVVMVLPGELHSFVGTGDKILRIICVVPLVDGRMPGIPAVN